MSIPLPPVVAVYLDAQEGSVQEVKVPKKCHGQACIPQSCLIVDRLLEISMTAAFLPI